MSSVSHWKLSIVIPVYYNRESLPEYLDAASEFESWLEELGAELELIFVDDGSQDGSFELLAEYRSLRRPATKILRLARNFGASSAWKAGLQYVTGDCFVGMAADGQESFESVKRMIPEWKNGARFVICVRSQRGDPLLTRWLARAYYSAVRILALPQLPRDGFDLMLCDRVMLQYFVRSMQRLNPQLYAAWLGFRPAVVEHVRLHRKHGRSRWTAGKKAAYALETLSALSVVPVRVISATGLLMTLASLILFTLALFGRQPQGDLAVVASLILFVGGFILMALGILGEYVWRVFLQVSERPDAVVAEMLV